MNDLNIACFLSVVRTGNFSVTARELYITQQAVSRNIQKLEEELGMQLFDRRNNTFRLTRAGEGYCRWFTDVQAELARAELLYGEGSRQDENRLCLGWCTWSGLEESIEKAIREFGQRNPDVAIAFREGTSSEIQEFWRMGMIDVALLPEYTAALLPGAETCGKVASLPLYTMTVEKDGAVDGLTCLIEDSGSGEKESEERLRALLDMCDIKAGGVKFMPNTGAVFAALQCGGSFTLMPDCAISRTYPNINRRRVDLRASLCAVRRKAAGKNTTALCRWLEERGADA
jgi:DNA-binding transcriptional LysR family regulator